MPLLIWLIRHGQSTANAGAPATPDGDAPLTPLGVAQSREAAQAIGAPPSLVISSSLLRAKQSAAFILERWPSSPTGIWPIHEIAYLDPASCAGTNPRSRGPMIDGYWTRADPSWRHGPGAETFAEFVDRVRSFRQGLADSEQRFLVVIGHGQFFRALLLDIEGNLAATPRGMALYRATETSRPMANGEIIKLDCADQTKPVWRTISNGSASP